LQLDPSAAFLTQVSDDIGPTGKEPRLGGQLRQQAVWVDETTCIGCKYCANVASNTFVMEPHLGRSRAIRQDGDSTEIIQEAIDTCPVDCIHWVDFEELDTLKDELDTFELQPLGMLPKAPRRIKPRNIG
tara:strand:+ start:67 stop:456 length:390 start_codon:yes stop_codon:yes gene_type:complete